MEGRIFWTALGKAVGTAPLLCTLALAACGGGGGGGGGSSGSGGSASTPTYTIGVLVSGLAGSGLQLQLNGANTLSVTGNTHLTFPGSLADGSSYTVTVHAQPSAPSQTCTVAGGSGTIAGRDVTNVVVTCSTNTYTIGGMVAGMSGSGLQLRLNGNETLNISANQPFTFVNPIADGSPYNVVVTSQPSSPSQTCTVGNGSGSVAGGNITHVAITCATNTYTVSGTAAGLSGSGLQLQLNGGSNLNVTASGFVFADPIADGSPYNVTIRTQPSSPSQTCTVTNGTGTLNAANITNVQVSCATNSYLVGGTVTGLTGNSVVLQLNGTNNLTVTSANRNFTFPVAVASGSSYTVSVSTHPTSPSQTCTVTNGAGTIGGVNVSNIIVNCVTNTSSATYTIGGTVAGLTGSGLQLQLNGASTLPISADGSFTFTTSVADAATYNVTVSTSPSSPTQICTVANGSGTVAGGNVTNVAVSCATSTRTVAGNVAGLAGSGLQLQLNGANDLPVAASGGFIFGSAIAEGSSYAVTVRTQPSSPSQTCTVANGSGTAGANNISNVQVNCTTDTFPVSVSVNGLSGGTLTLRNNGADDLAITGNGSFTFASRVASGAAYAVIVASSPTSPTQTCTVAHGTGVVGNSAVTDVVINCAINTYTVGGQIAGLSGTGLVMHLNGGNALAVTGDGGFTFVGRIADGSAYTVTVATQPSSPAQTCTVSNGSGTVAGSIVTNVTVTCSVVKWAGAKQFGSSGDDVVNAVAIDSSNGDVVVIGCYQGALSGNQKGTCDMPGGHARAYVRKFDRTGEFRWEASLGNSGNTQANGLAIDGAGNIYVTGISQGALDGQSGYNDDDYFLVKYSSQGTKRWTGVYGGMSADRGSALTFDENGDLYLVGTVYRSSYDIYIAKFAAASLASDTVPPAGPFLDATFASAQAGSIQPNDFPFHIAADRAGYVYVSGTTLGSLSGNTNAGVEDTFVMKLDTTTLGEAWTRQIGTNSYDRNGGVAVDTAGNVYVAGSTGGSLAATNSTPGVNDLFVVKYDASGTEQWKRQVVSPGHDHVTGLASGAGNTVYITGYTYRNFNGNTNLDPSGNTTDMFLIKYDSDDGTKLWSRQTGTTTDDRPYAVAIDTYPGGGGAFVAGYTLGALDGNTNVGGADMFVIKYDAAGIRQ